MKNLSLFSLMLMAGLLLFLGGCQRDVDFEANRINEIIDQNYNLSNNFQNQTIKTNCNNDKPNSPNYRVTIPENVKPKFLDFLSEIDDSGKLIINEDDFENFGLPIPSISLFYQNELLTKLILPLYNYQTNSITSFYEIEKEIGSNLTFRFINRAYYNAYVQDINLKNRPQTLILNNHGNFFKIFDFAVCNISDFPILDNLDTTTEQGRVICVTDILAAVYIECVTFQDSETENRISCNYWDIVEAQMIVECPDQGGSNGSGDGGTGWNGPGGNYSGSGSSSGGSINSALAGFYSDLAFLDNWLNSKTIDKFIEIIMKSDNSQDCLKIPSQFLNILKNNNYSSASINALNCLAKSLSITTPPSAPDDCFFTYNTSINNLINNYENMPSTAYALASPNSALGNLVCELANSSLTQIQINNLINAINNFIPKDVDPIMLDIDGNPIGGVSNGPNYHWMADELVDLITDYPLLNLDQQNMEWLLNNFSELQYVRSYLDSKNNESERNLGMALSSAYTKLSMEGESQISLGSGDPNSPIYDIMSEMLFEAIKEQLIDIIPGMTFATIAPQFAANVKDGNWLEAMDNALTIVLNEGDTLFPAVKIANVSLGLYTSSKQIKRVFEVFDNIRINQFPTSMITKIYNTCRNRLNLSILYLKNNFRWLGNNQGAKLDGVSASDFFNNIKDEYGLGAPVFFDNNYPVFKIDISGSTAAIFLVSYPQASSGYNWTVQFTIGPKTSTSMPNGSTYKIRFDY